MKFQNEKKVQRRLRLEYPPIITKFLIGLISFFALTFSLNNHPSCLSTHSTHRTLSSSFERQVPVASLVESKLRVTSEFLIQKIKKIQGQTISLNGPDGKAEFKIEFYKKYRYTDVFYDVIYDKEFLLYNKKGVLRNRTRYDFINGKRFASFTGFQFKESIAENARLDISYFNLDHLKRKEFQNTKQNIEKIMNQSEALTKEEAARSARQLIHSNAPLVAVLFAQSDRYSMLVTPLKKIEGYPSFYLSFDTIKYQTMAGTKSNAKLYEIVIEVADNFSNNSAKQLKNKVQFVSSLTSFLQKRFDLRAPLASKYELGLEATGMAIP